MASPQLENGYTMIANELVEALARYDFPPKTGMPPRLVLFVIRQTYGYHKKSDTISLSRFQRGVGEKNRSNLTYWLNYLVQARILLKGITTKKGVQYGLNKNYEEWLPLVQVRALVQVRSWGSASTSTKTSASNRTYKRKKDNTKETSADAHATPTFSPLGAEVIKAFEEVDSKNKTYYGNKTQRLACDFLLSEHGLEQIKAVIAILPRTNEMPYFPKIFSPYDLKEKWESLRAEYIRHKAKLPSNQVAFA